MKIMLNKDPISRITRRFDLNRRRVESLLNIYEQSNFDETATSQRQDILRSAVVFIHAMLEDLLRELIRWKAPIDNEEFAGMLRFHIGSDESNDNSYVRQVSILQLSRLGERNIEKIIEKAIEAHLKKRSFSDETQITHALNLIGIDTKVFKYLLPRIKECVERRHAIVHRGDRSDHNAITHGRPKSINANEVAAWNEAVGELGELLFELLPATPKAPAPKKLVKKSLPKAPKASGGAAPKGKSP